MLTIEEVKKEMDANEEVELECINEAGFISLYKCNGENNKIILNQGVLAVERVCSSEEFVYLKGVISPSISNVISFEELKYFRIKRPAPTFHDLIDVATQALKDGLLSKLDIIEGNSIGGTVKKGLSNVLHFHTGIATDIQSRIDFIKSLYAETFTVQGEDEIKRIKAEAKATLANGVDIWVKEANGSGYINACEIGSTVSITLNLISLKGAKVTQNRGAQC